MIKTNPNARDNISKCKPSIDLGVIGFQIFLFFPLP